MILLIAIPAALAAVALICGGLYEYTPLGYHVDRLLAGAPAEPEIVYELADLFDLTVLDSYPGGDL